MEIKAQKDQFDYIYRVYYKQLFIFAKRYVAEDEDCCDLVGDVFEYLWAHFDSVNLPTVQSYLYTILRAKCISLLRRRKTEQRFIDYAMASSQKYDTEDHIREMKEREEKIKQVLDSLPPVTLAIFTRCFVQHMKYAEAAADLQVSVATVKKHIVRALKQIRDLREVPQER